MPAITERKLSPEEFHARCGGEKPYYEYWVKIDPAFEPIPDVIASEDIIPDPYPTKPFEVAIEILSPDDSRPRTIQKCRLYEKCGIRQIVVIDSRERLVLAFRDGAFRESDVIATRGERRIEARQLWDEVDRFIQPPQ